MGRHGDGSADIPSSFYLGRGELDLVTKEAVRDKYRQEPSLALTLWLGFIVALVAFEVGFSSAIPFEKSLMSRFVGAPGGMRSLESEGAFLGALMTLLVIGSATIVMFVENVGFFFRQWWYEVKKKAPPPEIYNFRSADGVCHVAYTFVIAGFMSGYPRILR